MSVVGAELCNTRPGPRLWSPVVTTCAPLYTACTGVMYTEFHQTLHLQSLVTARTMRCYSLASLLTVITLISSVLAVKTSKNDSLQPYKFVKPLKDLEDIFKKASDDEKEDVVEEDIKVEESDEVPDKIQSRSGEAHPLRNDLKNPLMSDELSPPDVKSESLPQPSPLSQSRMRNRQRTSSTFRERMSNHKTDEEEKEEKEELEEVDDETDKSAEKTPVAEPLRAPMPEEYYYYDDYPSSCEKGNLQSQVS